MKYNYLNYEETRVILQKGTEAPFSGEHEKNRKSGTYLCKRCNARLYESKDKFDARCGWPAFYDASKHKNVKTLNDTSFGTVRIEVRCAVCDGHLGHVFPYGPEPTGMRYCINSASLRFIPVEDLEKEGYGEFVKLFDE